MFIKKDKEYWTFTLVMHISIIAAMVAFYFGLDLSLGSIFVIYTPLLLVVILWMIGYGRTFILSREGCTIRFLCFQKTYSWEELQTKRIEQYPKHPLVHANKYNPYKKYVVLAPYRVRKPRWVDPIYYNSLHPWSYIYLNFYNPDDQLSLNRKPGEYTKSGQYYEVDETEFREKMRQWNVAMVDDRT